MELEELAKKYGTDKQAKDHNYTEMYSLWLNERRNEIEHVVEIGFGNGASAKMWAEFFPNALIHVIEYCGDEYKNLWKSPDLLHVHPRIRVVFGNQADEETWKSIPMELDLVIDDGSHVPEHQISSVLFGFSKLKRGGLWFIEDTHCNFHKNYNQGEDKIYSWIIDKIIFQQIPHLSTDGNFYRNRQFIIDNLSHNIYSYHFYKSVILLERA